MCRTCAATIVTRFNGGAGTQATRATARGVGNFCRLYFLDGLGRSPAQPSNQPLIHFVSSSVQTPERRPRSGLDPESPTLRGCDPHRRRPAPTLPAAAVARRLPPSTVRASRRLASPTSPPPGRPNPGGNLLGSAPNP
jgi:hypothetical protein